ncbi:hypothetical protein [Neoroseomonas rubea]|nr:hypothetical protein [Roseomonas rubea]
MACEWFAYASRYARHADACLKNQGVKVEQFQFSVQHSGHFLANLGQN